MTAHGNRELARWGTFLAVIVALSSMIFLGWLLVRHQNSPSAVNPLLSDATVSVGLLNPPDSLDIRTQQGESLDQALLGNVYETLTSRSESNTITPGLAKSWTIADDGKTYTFTLNSDMRFANGNALDSSDVVWSLEQTITHHYVDADSLGQLTSVKNPDAHTVEITLGKQNPNLLRALSTRAGIVYDAEETGDYTSQAFGSGPFTISQYQQGQAITLTRNTRYWGRQSASSRITLRYFSDETALTQAVKDGEVNMALPLSATAAKALSQYPAWQVVTGASTSKVLVAFNNGVNSIFSDQRVRQATRYLIDSATIASTQPDADKPLGGPISPLEPGYEDLTGLFPYDPVKGGSMLEYFSASYLGTMTFVVPKSYESLGDTIAKQLNENSRLNVVVQVVDDSALQQRIDDGDYSMALTTMNDTGDAKVFAESTFGYENGDVQNEYNAALAATNDKDYQELLRAYAKDLSQDAPAEWLYTRKDFIAVKNHLEGYPNNMTDTRLPLVNLVTR